VSCSFRKKHGAYLHHFGLRPPDIFQEKPGFTSSPPRMFMFGITTFMFILGIIALVLRDNSRVSANAVVAQPGRHGVWSSYRTNVVIAVGATITRLMVRSHCCPLDSTNSCSVYFKRYYLRLACCGSLEQRQTCHRHSSALHPWDHRYIKWILKIAFSAHRQPTLTAAAGCDLGLSLSTPLQPIPPEH
jgi:hypothetical protein